MFRVFSIIFLLFVMGFNIFPLETKAVVGGEPAIKIPNPLQAKTFTELIEKIGEFIFVISIPVTIIVVLAGAYQFITAAGEPEKLQKARATLLWAAVGFALVLISFSVVTIIREVLGVQ